jgi:hypothetical protein
MAFNLIVNPIYLTEDFLLANSNPLESQITAHTTHQMLTLALLPPMHPSSAPRDVLWPPRAPAAMARLPSAGHRGLPRCTAAGPHRGPSCRTTTRTAAAY